MAEPTPPSVPSPQYTQVPTSMLYSPQTVSPFYTPYRPQDYLGVNWDVMQQQASMIPQLTQAQLSMMPAIADADAAYARSMMPVSQEYQNMLNASNLGYQRSMIPVEAERAMSAIPGQVATQSALMQGAFGEQMRQLPISTQASFDLASAYAPGYQRLFSSMADVANPNFMPTYNKLGWSVNKGLEAGYNLGEGLERELEQSIRGRQTAQGNWLGPAPTADEAFGKGQASINLYNQRIGQAQGFLQGKQPSDLWGNMGMTIPQGGANAPYYPSASFPGMYPTVSGSPAASGFLQNPGYNLGAGGTAFGQGISSIGQWNATDVGAQEATNNAQGNYNSALIGATDVNNEAIFNEYDRQFEQFSYEQAVANGLYSTPSTGGSMSGMGSMIGAGIGAVGAIGGGLASAGAFGGAAAAGAAAICWLARKALPERWEEFREFLFTKAPAWFRQKYIYGARQLANAISNDELREARNIMTLCLQH